jgi:hypothetical protein
VQDAGKQTARQMDQHQRQANHQPGQRTAAALRCGAKDHGNRANRTHASARGTQGASLKLAEVKLIEDALKHHDGNPSKAARAWDFAPNALSQDRGLCDQIALAVQSCHPGDRVQDDSDRPRRPELPMLLVDARPFSLISLRAKSWLSGRCATAAADHAKATPAGV